MAAEGLLFVVSAPSGAGKHAVLERVLEQDANLAYAVSATTRAPREGEVDGRDYVFLDEAAFRRHVAAGAFAEWAEVHGNLYGTLWSALDGPLAAGRDVVLEIDVQGMRQVKALRPGAVTVFIMPPSAAELERRLRGRGTEDEAVIARRLENARGEMAARAEYDYVIVNDELEQAVCEVLEVVRAHRARTGRQR